MTCGLLHLIAHREDEGDMVTELRNLKLTKHLSYPIPTKLSPVQLIKKFSSFASPSSLTRRYPNSYCMIE